MLFKRSKVEASFDFIKIDTNKRDIFRKCFCKLEYFKTFLRPWTEERKNEIYL